MWLPVISFNNAKTGRIKTDETSDRRDTAHCTQLSSGSGYPIVYRLTVSRETNMSAFNAKYAREEAFYPGLENSLSHYRR